jgi:hypothetical protein
MHRIIGLLYCVLTSERSTNFSFVILLFGISGNVITLSILFVEHILSILERRYESALEILVDGVSAGLGILIGLRFLGLDGGGSLSSSILLKLGNNFSMLLGEWVESLHNGFVGQWVLLVLVVSSDASSDFSQFGLNLIGIDNSGDIGAVHDGSVESVTLLLLGDVGWSSENGVKSFESILGEDDESSEVTSWGELEDVKSVHAAGIDSWEISSGGLDTGGLVSIDDKWTFSHDVSGVSVFSSTLSDLLGLSDLSKIVTGSEVLEGSEDGLGVWKSQVVDDEWELWDLVDVMTSGHNKWSASSGGESGGNGMSSLGDVNLCVPFSPDLKWSEHSSFSAHVTESSLTSSGGTGTRDSWDSCYGSTCSPGFGGVLSTSFVENGVTLSSVLGKLRVDEMHKIVSDWDSEDTGHGDAISDFFSAFALVD